jgi:hypothetical protein
VVYWTDQEGLQISDLNENSLKHFDHHLEHCQCPGYGHTDRFSFAQWCSVVFEISTEYGFINRLHCEPPNQDPVLLVEFRHWMSQQRGSGDLTLYNYGLCIRSLLRRLGEDPGKFDAQRLRQFVLETSQQSGWAKAKTCTTALRMFLRFLISEGKCIDDLDGGYSRSGTLAPFLSSAISPAGRSRTRNSFL